MDEIEDSDNSSYTVNSASIYTHVIWLQCLCFATTKEKESMSYLKWFFLRKCEQTLYWYSIPNILPIDRKLVTVYNY